MVFFFYAELFGGRLLLEGDALRVHWLKHAGRKTFLFIFFNFAILLTLIVFLLFRDLQGLGSFRRDRGIHLGVLQWLDAFGPAFVAECRRLVGTD